MSNIIANGIAVDPNITEVQRLWQIYITKRIRQTQIRSLAEDAIRRLQSAIDETEIAWLAWAEKVQAPERDPIAGG